jgi:NADP-dependent 3-hydroxy acid dehydrogenase YdfG
MRFRENGRGLLAGKVDVVPGVGTGLGRSIAMTLADEAARAVLAARDGDRLDQVAAEITSAGGVAIAVPTDVSVADQCACVVDRAVEEFGRLDIVVNNGHHQGHFTLLAELNIDEWESVFAVNLCRPMRITQAAVPIMRRQGDGRIVNVNSGAVVSCKPTLGAYSASKAGLASITKTLALRLGHSVIRAKRYLRELDGRRQRRRLGNQCGRGRGHHLRRMARPQERSRVRHRHDAAPRRSRRRGALPGVGHVVHRHRQLLSANNGQWVEGNQ